MKAFLKRSSIMILANFPLRMNAVVKLNFHVTGIIEGGNIVVIDKQLSSTIKCSLLKHDTRNKEHDFTYAS